MPRTFIRRLLRAPRLRRAALALAACMLAPVVALAVAAAATPLPEVLRENAYSTSVTYLDRHGGLLREVRADDAARARWVPLDQVGPLPVMAVLAAEDRRFYAHPGVDPVAVVRAVVLDAVHWRIVSGASTLTMQLARLVHPRPRTLGGKLAQMALALRIEASLSKKDILEQYMNRAPFGPGVRGIDAASRLYFDKPPAQLSLAEAATLAAVPRGPTLYSLAKHPARVERRRDRILDRMLHVGWISPDAYGRAKADPVAVLGPRGGFGAPHFVAALAGGSLAPGLALQPGEAETVTTTLDRTLQREAEVEVAATTRVLARRHATAASVVVLDNTSGEVLAYVGSPNFGDVQGGGQNDGVRARRQPGSTLKPFVYGLAMERLGFTAATTLPDVELHLPVSTGVYAPNNYDERFHGPVRLREALGNSLNVPAVWTAAQVGTGPLLDRLHTLGFASLADSPENYGPGLALGDGEVTLLELANAYATLARRGVWKPVRVVQEAWGRGGRRLPVGPPTGERRVMPEYVADLLTDVLRDDHARAASFGERSVLDLPFEVAVKTGTSKGYRDNWTVGYTRQRTVAVWVGNFDGGPMEGVSGITGAGPLFRAVMQAAMRDAGQDVPLALTTEAAAEDDLVEVEVCPLSGAAPTRDCPHAVHEWVPRGRADLPPCNVHARAPIDRRNGLLAGRGCPAAFVEERAFEQFEPRYQAWAKVEERPSVPAAYSPLCPATNEDRRLASSLKVAYPRDGARYVVDPDRPLAAQTLSVRVEVPAGVSRVALRIDGAVSRTSEAPFVLQWRLARGNHVLVAEAAGLPPSEPVHLEVE